MKKRILLIALVISFISLNKIYCQCMPWYTSGNTISGGSSIFGTLDPYSVYIYGDNHQVGIITGATSNYGNYEMGIAGSIPQNKLLVETGTISSAAGCVGSTGPYSDLCPLGFVPSDFGIFSYSNNLTSGSNNIGVASVANATQPYGVGYVGLISNADNNVGMFLQVTGAANSSNVGEQLQVTGATPNTSNGIISFTGGSTVENDGILSDAVGSTSLRNIGIQGDATGSTNSSYGNPGGNIGVYGFSHNASVSPAINTAIKGIAQGNGAYNQGFLGNVSGDGSINAGYKILVSGNGNSAWGGPGVGIINVAATGNFGTYASTYGANSINVGGIGEVSDNGNSSSNNNSALYGLIGSCVSASTCTSQYGVWGYIGNSPSTSLLNYGVFGDLSNLTAAALTSGDVYYAVYGVAPAGTSGGTSASIVSGTNAYSAYAGYFDGDVFSSGTYLYSDSKLKENITKYTGALDKLNQLEIKNYTFKQKDFPTMNLPQGHQVGVLAEDLKKVFPELVKHSIQPAIKGLGDAVDFEAVNYTSLIPVLVQAVKELDAKTDPANATPNPVVQQQQIQIDQLTNQLTEQTKQISDLKSMLNDICNLGCAGLQSTTGNNQSVVLYQSIPNPTAGSATIGYVINIPFTSASINVTSTDGNSIQAFKITQGGKGSIVFDGSTYASGTFRYSLYIDGKLYDTKSIVITKE